MRREGSFVYEEFLHTEGVDVKVYAVGTEYAHAEARKAPTLDGKVSEHPQICGLPDGWFDVPGTARWRRE